MARGSGKDPRETFAIDRLRFRERGTNPNAAPPKYHCELFFKDGALYQICDDGTVRPIGGLGVSASPGFTWGKSGNVTTNRYLDNDGVPSNRTGRYVFFSNPVLRTVLISNEGVNTFDVTIQQHDGTTFTDVATVSVNAARAKAETVNVALTAGQEIAIKITSGSCKNPVVGLVLDGVF